MKTTKAEQLEAAFRDASTLRSSDLERLGISRPYIQEATRLGLIERQSRGLYTFPKADITENHALVQATKRTPNARICLLSALKFHDLTSQNPYEVWIAIGRKDRKPAYESPPIQVVRFSGAASTEGVEQHIIEGTTIQIYSVAKTIVDLFRYRNKLGIDIAIEALREGWSARRFSIAEIDRIATACRAKAVMAPYLESVIA
ncbi:AbiEi antitoxin N-terminal domain-containing protein [Pelagicoccus sp. SDUM812002]|uniref:type IV toxin-antitoxin system AbiEi family antitoxin domain-containing protein n=1 Tax=Pelagicoccus sp. SDUM812002 TaxID=3041266 RepID=UPI00280CC91E|nr:AbiEi antitoxin N-terminal domain-containing protein [Pelagicoccus sp. SDUM812002]MDQ8188560.1 type IV toxin-antitoxin system AbiEi family antitoxin domain-containing protein [Pelagicoccus sp. SDUM812002]